VELESIFGIMEQFIRENLKMELDMVKEFGREEMDYQIHIMGNI